MTCAAFLILAACSAGDPRVDAPVDVIASCAELRASWQSIVSGLSTSCSATGDCMLVGGVYYGCDGRYASISQACGGDRVNAAAYRGSGAPALAQQWSSSGCEQSFYPKIADCLGAVLSCDHGTCRAQDQSCLPPPHDAGG